MHTRRLAAFVLGAWLLGSLLMMFVLSQSQMTVDRILGNPPGPVAKDLEDLGPDVTRQLLRYEASELNRYLLETWGIVQLGIGVAFLSSVTFTAHRSRFMVVVSALMVVLVAVNRFYHVPALAALGRSFDFLPLAAAAQERENYQRLEIWYRVGEIIKLIFGFSLMARLLVDRYGWKEKWSPSGSSGKSVRRRKVRREPSASSPAPEAKGAPAAPAAAGETSSSSADPVQ